MIAESPEEADSRREQKKRVVARGEPAPRLTDAARGRPIYPARLFERYRARQRNLRDSERCCPAPYRSGRRCMADKLPVLAFYGATPIAARRPRRA